MGFNSGFKELNCVFKESEGDLDCVNLAQDRVKWRALVNTVQ